MSKLAANKQYLWEVAAAKSHRLLEQAHGTDKKVDR